MSGSSCTVCTEPAIGELTIGEALKQEGYQTAHIGKWNCSIDSLTYPQYQVTI